MALFVFCCIALGSSLENNDTGRNSGIQRIDLPLHRDRDKEVAVLQELFANPLAFTADHHEHGASPVDFVVILGPFAVGSSHPETLLFEFEDRLSQIADPANRDVLDRSSRGLGHRAVQTHGTSFGDNDTVNACSIGNSQDRTEIVPILQFIQHHQERCFPFFLDRSQQIIQFDILMGCHLGNHTLMRFRFGHLVEGFALNFHDHGTRFPGLSHDSGQDQVWLAISFRNPELVERTASLEGFLDGIATFEAIR